MNWATIGVFALFFVPALAVIAINGLWGDGWAWAAVAGLCGGQFIAWTGVVSDDPDHKNAIAAIGLAMMLGGLVAASFVRL
ncbi:MAG: hypothetical protein ACLFTP_09700 [Rhodosalinus sp.]